MAQFNLTQNVSVARKSLDSVLKDAINNEDVLPYRAYLNVEDRPAVNSITDLRKIINKFGKENMSYQIVPSYTAHKQEIFIPMKSFSSFSEAISYADSLIDTPNKDGISIKPSFISVSIYANVRSKADRSAFSDL